MSTTPDYAGLIERLRKPGTWARHGDDIIASDAKEELVRDDAPFEAATALRALLESNAELERERTNLIETKREQIDRLNTRLAELETSVETLRRHALEWEGRAEAAEAQLAEAMKALDAIIERSNNDPLGTSKVNDMRRIAAEAARRALTGGQEDG